MGQHEAGWHSFYDYFATACGMSETTQRMCGLEEVAQSANWWLPHRNICWVSERHGTLNRDGNGRLHCDDGPALAYPDGFSIYALGGVRLDEQVIMYPETQTVAQINGEENQDVRSIRIERFGWPRYLRESRAKVRDSRHNEIENTEEALMLTDRGEQRLVVTCPTGRIFALGVPGEVKTCEQAQHWLAGSKPFRVLART